MCNTRAMSSCRCAQLAAAAHRLTLALRIYSGRRPLTLGFGALALGLRDIWLKNGDMWCVVGQEP